MLAWLLVPFAVLAGALTTIQAGSNAALKKSIGEPLPALLINYGLGIGVVVLANLITRQSWPGFDKLSGVPWWAWVGGLAGAAYGLAAILLAYRLGAATLMASVVTGQVIASVLLDHFGWLGFEVHTASVWRLLGAALMIIGVALVARF
jgi:bacterial/archaeal transporter family-2 protein